MIDAVAPGDGPADRLTRRLAVAGAIGVVVYVVSWAVAGTLIDGYDPLHDAISETFAIGAPAVPRTLMTTVLIVTGALLVVTGWALDRGLPGQGRAGPVAAAISGIGTIGAAVFPCTAGCPGFGTTFTDSAHTVVAGIGYVALIVTPLLVVPRVRPHAPALARLSLVLGALALAGFVVRNVGLTSSFGGLQQRIFNTVADIWFVAAAVWIVRRHR